MKRFVAFVLILELVTADVYLHNPRGSNNRVIEKTATRKNNNRMFDSQNNARGGFNVGDKTAQASNNENQQYRMRYFQSGLNGVSELLLQWTNQHGCGADGASGPSGKLNCNIVLQYKCQKNNEAVAPADSVTLRNGKETNTQDYTETNDQDEAQGKLRGRRNGNVKATRGLQESWEWYDACYKRERNKGLFLADQQPRKNKQTIEAASTTRQNPNGGRSGYECPEERDYYPYWHPSPWTDIAVLAHQESMCDYYKKNSFNRKPYGLCVHEYPNGSRKPFSPHNNPEACATHGGQWLEYYSYLELAPLKTNKAQCEASNNNIAKRHGIVYVWGKPYDEYKIMKHEKIDDACFVQPPPVECKPSEWSRVNHLGDGLDATPANYTWKLPHFPSLEEQRCVLRIRYNISTDDYEPFATDATFNQVKKNNVVIKKSPIVQNPLVNIGASNQPLRLAINTAQFGRTFQDRSHVFHIAPRPDEVSDDDKLINLNVRGKRGNIVQTYPAVEYDFIPNRMSIKDTDLVHVQWTGSNTHNNQAPGGDGQTGDAGEGKGGTDRHNLLQLRDPSENFPVPYKNSTLYKNMKVIWNSAEKKTYDELDIALQLGSAGYYECAKSAKCGENSVESKAKLDKLLNNASPSYAGLITTFKRGIYYYMCSRNNNFSNRSQKGHIIVN